MAVSWCLFQWFFFVRKFGCFQKCWVSPTISIGWTLLKMIILGCEMGVPLFLETPIWLICCVWKFVWYCFCQTIWLIFFGRDLFDIVLLRNLFEHFLGSNLFDSFCQKSGAYDNVLYTVRLKLLRSCLALATPWLFFFAFLQHNKDSSLLSICSRRVDQIEGQHLSTMDRDVSGLFIDALELS